MLGSCILTSTSRTEIPPAILCGDGLAFKDAWLCRFRGSGKFATKIEFRKVWAAVIKRAALDQKRTLAPETLPFSENLSNDLSTNAYPHAEI
jgi:hypothetical protein